MLPVSRTKKVFTTGDVAKICKVAPRTAGKWVDARRLGGYRIPGSDDRRIPREYLIRFMAENGMPLGELREIGMRQLLVYADECSDCPRFLLDKTLRDMDWSAYYAVDSFAAAQLLDEHPFPAMLLDCRMPIATVVIQRIRNLRACQKMVLIGLVTRGTPKIPNLTDQYELPVDPELIVKRMLTLLGEGVAAA